MLNSDEQVINATIAALNIFEKAKCRRNKTNSNSEECNSSQKDIANKPSEATNSLTVDSLSSANDVFDSNSGDFERTLQSISSKDLSEYQNIMEALEVINLMYSFYHEQKSVKKGENFQSIIETFKDVMSPNLLQAQIDKISKVLDHVTRISENGAKLKQVLRSNVLNDYWKINADYHRSVLNVFSLAEELMSDVSQFITSIEESKKHNPSKTKNLHLLETKLLMELQENVEILQEFRKYIHTLINQDPTK